MIPNNIKVAIIGILLIVFGVCIPGHTEETKSNRIERLRNQACRENIIYIDNTLIKVIHLYAQMNVIETKLPKDKSMDHVRDAITTVTYEIDNLVSDINLQSAISSNACTDLMFDGRHPTLADNYDNEKEYSKSDIIAGLSFEMCDIYATNLAQIIYSVELILKNLNDIYSNGNVKVIAINEKIGLTEMERDLTRLLNTMKSEFKITQNVCLNFFEGASKSEFWRTANMERNSNVVNPYLILLFIYD